MSYDIRLCDPVTHEALQTDVPHDMRGGTYAMGGTTGLWLNVTYNYGKHYYRVLGDKGIRAMVCDGLEYMGVKLDPAANDVRGKETVISAADSKVKVLLIPTNEELMIAMDTEALVG